MLTIPIPSSLITHLSISGQLQSYCDLICRHELYVEHLTSIIGIYYVYYSNKVMGGGGGQGYLK
jgi:hypothetical protein